MSNKTLWFCKAYKFQVEVLAKHVTHSDLKFFLFGLINHVYGLRKNNCSNTIGIIQVLDYVL